MEFAALAQRLAAVEDEDADTETVSLVAALFADAGADLPVVARFVQGRVFPAHDSATLDVGPRLCYEALARAAGPNVGPGDVEDRLAETGDVGAVAEGYDLGGQRGLSSFVGDDGGAGEDRAAAGADGAGSDGRRGGGDALTVAAVDERLREVAAAAGAGSEGRKVGGLFGLFTRCSPLEARYLARLVLGELRVGVGEGTVRDAVAEAFDVPVAAVERALQVSNDYGLVAETAREAGVDGLDAVRLEVGRPVQAMLAQAGTVADAREAWGTVGAEWKFDGARVQLHYDGEAAALFSRNMEDVTDALPEVAALAEEHLSSPVILDGEVVAVDDDGDPLPFQEVLRRFRRKHDVDRAREDVAVEFYAFDCLHADGEDLLDAPLVERHGRLEGLLPAAARSELVVTDDPETVAAVEAEALAADHEGILLKNPESAYTPGRRGRNWLKRKPDVDTLDLAVVGAEWGEGRRASLFGTYLLAARADDARGGPSGPESGGSATPASRDGRDDDAEGGDAVAVPEGFATVGKVATGFTDEDLAALTERLEPRVRREAGTAVSLEPELVFEVGFDEIQRSPTYASGYALRFPRFLGVREDKDPADADDLSAVERLADDDGGVAGEDADADP